MPQRNDKAEPDVRYWQRRLRSSAFRRELSALLRRELKALAGERVKDVVDPELVRSILREWDTRMIDRARLTELVLEGIRRAARGRPGTLGRRLDDQLVSDIEALVREGFTLSAGAKDAIAEIMQQEFVRRLFTDVIFSAIVSFYQRVNPLFGAMAMRVLEEQIKGFIRFFMPMLQQQATAFVINPTNQRVAVDFVSTVIRQLLEQPLPRYWVTPGQRRQLEELVRHALANAKLDAIVRDATLAAWDDLYAIIDDKRVGELLRIEGQASWLAERCVEMIVPALSRPHIIRFVAAEMTLAAGVAGTARPRPRRP